MLPLPTVNEDRGPEKDSDEHHLDGVLHALQPGAPIMSPTLAHPQPLPNAVRVPSVVPIAGINDVPHMLARPIHRLHAVPNVDVADRRIDVLCGGHLAQATKGKRWQILRSV